MTAFRKDIDTAGLRLLAQRLVRTPSLSTQEGAVARLVAEEMTAAGFDEVTVDRMGNVIGRIGPEGERGLLYDAHMDTVAVAMPRPGRATPRRRDRRGRAVRPRRQRYEGRAGGHGLCGRAAGRRQKAAQGGPCTWRPWCKKSPARGWPCATSSRSRACAPTGWCWARPPTCNWPVASAGASSCRCDVHGRSCHAIGPRTRRQRHL